MPNDFSKGRFPRVVDDKLLTLGGVFLKTSKLCFLIINTTATAQAALAIHYANDTSEYFTMTDHLPLIPGLLWNCGKCVVFYEKQVS